jgi:DNA-binding NtrC family response regulator
MASALGGTGQDASPDQATEEHMAKWVRQALAAHQDEHVFEALMDRFGALLVREALNLTGGNRSRAARLLGMSRPTLLARIEKYGLKLETKAS